MLTFCTVMDFATVTLLRLGGNSNVVSPTGEFHTSVYSDPPTAAYLKLVVFKNNKLIPVGHGGTPLMMRKKFFNVLLTIPIRRRISWLASLACHNGKSGPLFTYQARTPIITSLFNHWSRIIQQGGSNFVASC